ncbi:sigma-54 dependent transcriptional regulator [Spirochaetia bacterium 38H-sp]|uniref:Sigma-54 dependent transcriptional regulator n=1 Tax=Rarispira pelagica TaxID=3141764 RepID=A0ABU9U997_9SPIR
MIKIVLVTKKEDLAYYLKNCLEENYSFFIAKDIEALKETSQENNPDIIFFHVENETEKDQLLTLLSNQETTQVAVISPITDSSFIVFCMENGAIDFINNPETDRIKETIKKALKKKLYNTKIIANSLTEKIIGTSDAITRLKEYLPMLAQVTETVLISGESGTGKELVARTIHKISPRKEFPFVAVNCGALPASIIESEMFGTEAGAYTDAKNRPGFFEQANGGTLFLDEIGELPLDLQVKFLRVLEEKQISRLGGHRVIPIDIRIICATNKNLKEEVKNRNFREDLYYRINILKVDLPPLRNRKEDIVLLTLFFLKEMEKEYGKIEINEKAIERLNAHDWPGNIRELKNIVSRAVIDSKMKGRKIILPDSIIFD